MIILLGHIFNDCEKEDSEAKKTRYELKIRKKSDTDTNYETNCKKDTELTELLTALRTQLAGNPMPFDAISAGHSHLIVHDFFDNIPIV